MRLVDNYHLENWARSRQAQSELPRLIRWLIKASINPSRLSMPSGNAVGLSGLDGVVQNNEQNEFVPMGRSVWEIGTNNEFMSKASNDYRKRTNSNEITAKSEITFVIVSPYAWDITKKGKWEDRKNKEKVWKNVMVVDGEDIKNWLNSSASVLLEFSSQMGILDSNGIESFDSAWNNWSRLSDPPISESFVTAGRQEQENKIINEIARGQPSNIRVQGDSCREAYGFVLAAIKKIENEDFKISIISRVVVCENEKIAAIIPSRKNLIIILRSVVEEISGSLSAGIAHVIVPEANEFSVRQMNVIALSRPNREQVMSALLEMHRKASSNLNEAEIKADQQTRACGLSVTIFLRQNASVSAKRPYWSERAKASPLLPALLAGQWDGNNDLDQKIICKLSGKEKYEDYIYEIEEFSKNSDPPLRKISNIWSLSAPIDAFHLLARHLKREHFDLLSEVFLTVFEEIDPKTEIDKSEWLAHDIRGAKCHSALLRSGLAETILLIAERGHDAEISVIDPREYVEKAIGSLQRLAEDWRLLASLRDQSARFMEAAPRPLLDCLEQLLEAKPADVAKLFEEGANFHDGGPMHFGLLNGLEALAWNPRYLPRVTLILAELAKIDPGGRWGNRPINSLRAIFLCWYPQTNADLKGRLDAIDLVLERLPDVGWSLLNLLLPSPMISSTSMTMRPRWMIVGGFPMDTNTAEGQVQYAGEIIARALKRAGLHVDRWRALLDALPMFNSHQRDQAISQLSNAISEDLSDSHKSDFWGMIRDYINNNSSFSDSYLIFSPEVMKSLENMLKIVEPEDPIAISIWLFNKFSPRISNIRDGIFVDVDEDIRESEKRLAAMRQLSVKNIFNIKGIDGILEIALSCKFSWIVAFTAVHVLSLEQITNLIKTAINHGERGIEFCTYLSGQAEGRYKGTWRSLIIQSSRSGTWTAKVTAALMCQWSDSRMTWSEISKLGNDVKSNYWKIKRIPIFEHNIKYKIYQINRFIEVGRSVDLLNSISHRSNDIPTKKMLRIFDDAMNIIFQDTEEEKNIVNPDSVSFFLQKLRERTDVSTKDIASREYKAAHLILMTGKKKLAFHELMAQSPSFYIEVICEVFFPANRNRENERNLTAMQQARVQAVYALLSGMTTIPGNDSDGNIDSKILIDWVTAARTLANDNDRAAVADIKIGEMLAYAPVDADGAWPHRAVRIVVETVRSVDLERGLQTGRFNMRGVVTRQIYDGGAQERKLEADYRQWAETSRSAWPRMAQVLENIADSWKRDAERQDERSEHTKLRDLG
jgi:hypothetical protein